MIDDYRADREIGDVDAIQGTMEGVTYNLWAMKEPDFIMKMMATGGSLIVDYLCRSMSHWFDAGVQMVKEFSYTLPLDKHF